MARIFSEDIYKRLKAATRRLVTAAGGVEGAEQVTRISKSQLGNCQNNNCEQYLPIDALIDLTKDTGDRAVVRELKRILKEVGADGTVSAAELNKDIMAAHKEGAEAIQAGMEAFEDDHLELHELRKIQKEADEAATAFLKIRDKAARRVEALQD